MAYSRQFPIVNGITPFVTASGSSTAERRAARSPARKAASIFLNISASAHRSRSGIDTSGKWNVFFEVALERLRLIGRERQVNHLIGLRPDGQHDAVRPSVDRLKGDDPEIL